MSIHTLSRCSVALVLVALVAGCSSILPGASSSSPGTGSSAASERVVSDNCKFFRSRCIYEGSYDAGERNYAEQEAKRLNTAELERLRRAFAK
ncbi:hypothetical protein G6F57_012729 [Rhizopus arrhizus]|jgi:hypothetical protein|uniref:Lipoprotein n=1 Tax=Achromobacter marplatensis TaxID=470868 RepID=A0AA42WBR0_9BURK|nr:hypothetical protein [Achromobacter marplatensis]KAG1078831.1 hypothetical protein G6F40_016554 [Rhizopus arrhizus]KAG1252132.1 hypothetical protein G6F65_018051 [Rhizopus arrhizus]KAG1468116.1 hypothetical protein G6F57_012729 [Rhizopus arrhizus]MDH2051341.1 hypothetical protein [Achromobacter marplatensis]